ncbi:ras GTPase-activating protein 1-like [Grus japonensis]|uniref:Ras GTPase-activating protein 1-like n=1 Tax=Grus japonensis TaxID=30415 RepID=A0ABC9X4V3_GRUJA
MAAISESIWERLVRKDQKEKGRFQNMFKVNFLPEDVSRRQSRNENLHGVYLLSCGNLVEVNMTMTIACNRLGLSFQYYQKGPPVKPVKVPLDGIPSLQCVDHTTQLGVAKLAEGALDPTIHVTNKDLKQCQSQYRPLRNATHHWSSSH